jgi:hypothetical protein
MVAATVDGDTIPLCGPLPGGLLLGPDEGATLDDGDSAVPEELGDDIRIAEGEDGGVRTEVRQRSDHTVHALTVLSDEQARPQALDGEAPGCERVGEGLVPGILGFGGARGIWRSCGRRWTQ